MRHVGGSVCTTLMKKLIEFLFLLDILPSQIQKSNISGWGFPHDWFVGVPVLPCISKVCQFLR